MCIRDRCRELLLDVAESQERERYIHIELEKATVDKTQLEKEKAAWYKREDKVERECQLLKLENKNLKKAAGCSKVPVNSQEVQCKGEMPNARDLEEEIDVLKREKGDLEGLLNTLVCNLPLPKLQKLFVELVDAQTNLLFVNKELRKKAKTLKDIEGELKGSGSVSATLPRSVVEMRSSQLRKDYEIVKEKVTKCKKEIEQHKGTMKAIVESIRALNSMDKFAPKGEANYKSMLAKENKSECANIFSHRKTLV
eukprot:TRINITY_DN16341_c0_g2_i3.p1 TRINITY_DN16341_c0_g2~~TRINITY_DN16341_c0_g2_i3.p1  ORF type:complete len:254 (+),score=75.15 TRINITY_DN16341_c0_g2_i3:73-834(+)